MKILLLAPHPFYQERGTPIAVHLLLRALSELGHSIDLLTYPEGTSPDYGPSVRIHRIPDSPHLRNIRPGFSLKKLRLDLRMAPLALRLARELQPDILHAIEESAFIARSISRRLGIPYIFDMDSSMPRQIADKLPLARPFLPLMRAIERFAIRSAAAVVPMCDALANDALAAGARRVEVLRDISLTPTSVPYDPSRGFRQSENLSGPVLLYIGNLEPYQGISLLLDAFALAAPAHPDATLVIVGGRPDDMATVRARADSLSLGNRVRLLGPRPVADMPHLFHDADILVSPRTQGSNTPMKIYSYLDSGRPTLATRLSTHTQVLDDSVAELAPPAPAPFAAAIAHLLDDPAHRDSLAHSARALAQARYSFPAFKETVRRLYDSLTPASATSQPPSSPSSCPG